jgi:hypothetical protein
MDTEFLPLQDALAGEYSSERELGRGGRDPACGVTLSRGFAAAVPPGRTDPVLALKAGCQGDLTIDDALAAYLRVGRFTPPCDTSPCGHGAGR